MPKPALARRQKLDLTACNHNINVHGKNADSNITWTQCCSPDPAQAPGKCPPVDTHVGTVCPAGYFNCADPAKHPEMCEDEVYGYGDTSEVLNQKCCPVNYACGPEFTSPCTLISLPPNNTRTVRTNPQFLTANGVFAGCNDGHEISAPEAGGAVAAGIIGFVAICAAGLWIVRRRLYRDPRRRSFSLTNKPQTENPNGDGDGDGVELKPPRTMESEADDADGGMKGGITVTKEVKVETPEEAHVYGGNLLHPHPPMPRDMGEHSRSASAVSRDGMSWMSLHNDGSDEDLQQRPSTSGDRATVKMPKLMYRDRNDR